MHKRALALLLVAVASFIIVALPGNASASGHDGFFFGLGYNQLFMLSPNYQRGPGNFRVKFSPGFGANLTFGYDFSGTRWGIQMPIEYDRIKLNSVEWVNYFGSTVEAKFRILESGKDFDFHLVGGLGWSYLTEGKIDDQSACAGMTLDVGPGITYFFSREKNFAAALVAEVPFRYIYYFGNHLSNNGTSVIAFPIRLSIQMSF